MVLFVEFRITAITRWKPGILQSRKYEVPRYASFWEAFLPCRKVGKMGLWSNSPRDADPIKSKWFINNSMNSVALIFELLVVWNSNSSVVYVVFSSPQNGIPKWQSPMFVGFPGEDCHSTRGTTKEDNSSRLDFLAHGFCTCKKQTACWVGGWTVFRFGSIWRPPCGLKIIGTGGKVMLGSNATMASSKADEECWDHPQQVVKNAWLALIFVVFWEPQIMVKSEQML